MFFPFSFLPFHFSVSNTLLNVSFQACFPLYPRSHKILIKSCRKESLMWWFPYLKHLSSSPFLYRSAVPECLWRGLSPFSLLWCSKWSFLLAAWFYLLRWGCGDDGFGRFYFHCLVCVLRTEDRLSHLLCSFVATITTIIVECSCV